MRLTMFLGILFTLALGLPSAATAEPVKLDGTYSHTVLAPGVESAVSVLIQLEAPILKTQSMRAPIAVSLVIDRSGSMQEEKKIDYAIQAGKLLVNSLEPTDFLGLTIYDLNVTVLRPLLPVTDKNILLKQLESITASGSTNLSGGLQAGIKLFTDNKKIGSADISRRVILLSDGLANHGITSAAGVAEVGAGARKQGVSVSTIGLGRDYDENMMQLLAQRAGGGYYYIKDSEDLPLAFKEEFNLAASLATQDLQVFYTPAPGQKDSKVYGYTTRPSQGKIEVESGNLSSGEKRQILLRIPVTPATGNTTQQLGTIQLSYVDRATGKKENLTFPLNVAVASTTAEAETLNLANAEKTKSVQEEVLIMEAEEIQLAAMKDLEEGKVEPAMQKLEQSKKTLEAAPAPSKARANKIEQLTNLRKQAPEAAARPAELKGMVKAGKEGYYKGAKGNKQGLMIQPGDSGYTVEKLQITLKKKGFYNGTVSGKYDASTQEAVKIFQKSAGIPDNGIAEQSTLDSLAK